MHSVPFCVGLTVSLCETVNTPHAARIDRESCVHKGKDRATCEGLGHFAIS